MNPILNKIEEQEEAKSCRSEREGQGVEGFTSGWSDVTGRLFEKIAGHGEDTELSMSILSKTVNCFVSHLYVSIVFSILHPMVLSYKYGIL